MSRWQDPDTKVSQPEAAQQDDSTPHYRWNDHRNQWQDWCVWSRRNASHLVGADDQRCPAKCPESQIEEGEPEPDPIDGAGDKCPHCGCPVKVADGSAPLIKERLVTAEQAAKARTLNVAGKDGH